MLKNRCALAGSAAYKRSLDSRLSVSFQPIFIINPIIVTGKGIVNLIFISPHFPTHYHRFCWHLKALGGRVLGIGDVDGNALSEQTRNALTDYYHVHDLHDYDALVRACGYFTYHYGKIDRIESHNEYWLDTDARIRDDFNIPGIRAKDIGTLRRKSGMKTVFKSAGLPVAPGILVRGKEEAIIFAEKTGYPLIAKPDAGVGALDTFRIDHRQALETFLGAKPDADYFLEAFVKGELFSYDGLTDARGKPVFITAHYFSQGIMETVNEGRHIFYYNLRRIPEALAAAGDACVRAFDIRERFFHIEFFHTGEQIYVPLEVNVRPPGGFTTDMMNYAADTDVYRAWAEVVMNGTAEIDYRPAYHCCYASRKSHHRYRHSEEDIRSRISADLIQVDRVPDVFRSALGDVGFILRHPDLDTLLDGVRAIHLTET